MAFDLVHQVKSRTRSVLLEKGQPASGASSSDSAPASKRSSSVMASVARDAASVASSTSSAAPSATGTTLHYRSMLDVDEPPSLTPLNPMSYDELYDPKAHESTKLESDGPSSAYSTEHLDTSGNTSDNQVEDLSCQQTSSRPCHACYYHHSALSTYALGCVRITDFFLA